MARAGKRIKAAAENIEAGKLYTFSDAVGFVKNNATTKFDETFDIAINLGVDPKHSDQMVRGMVSLPNGTGKTIRVAVFAKGDKQAEATKAGADLVGEEDLIERIQNGELNFDRCIATPDLMPLVSKVAKVLGPKGLMPNPKLGTVTQDVAKAVKEAKAGQVEFRVEKAGIIHAGVGKASFSKEQLEENIIAFLSAIQKAKPAGAKGSYFKKISVSSTMGPSIIIDVSDVLPKIASAA